MTPMNPVGMNAKAMWFALDTFRKRVKQWKHYLPVINLVLFIGAVSLAGICVLLVYYPPENTIKPEKYVKEIPEKNNVLPPLDTDNKAINNYELILSNNPFSPNRNAWAQPETKTGSKRYEEEVSQGIPQPIENQPKPRGTPKKITLRGILILGNIKKALIENPDQTVNKKPFIFIEEGDEIVEYKVKNIEPDQIKLDWYGEEQVVVMRSNIKK